MADNPGGSRATGDASFAAREALLYREAVRLTEEFHAHLTAGNDSGQSEFVEQREVVFAQIRDLQASAAAGAAGGEPDDEHVRESVQALKRIVELNQSILLLLEERKRAVRQQLAELDHGRRALAGYRGPSPTSASFVDRRE